MKRIYNEEISATASKIKICNDFKNIKYPFKKQIWLSFICFIFNLIIISITLIIILKKTGLIIIKKQPINNNSNKIKSNIDLNDEFFKIKTVQEQINNKNLTYIRTISGGHGHVGNALKMLNNLINIYEKIRCQNIISPRGLQSIIKKPIFYKE